MLRSRSSACCEWPCSAALPLQTLEHVARLFRYVRTPAGKAIFGQGQRGQCFFICETGEYKASARRQRSRTPNPVL